MIRRRQNALDLDTKLRMLRELDRGDVSKSKIAERYGIPKSTLSTILKSRDKIYDAFASGSVVHKAKRMRSATYKEVEDKLVDWINQMRSIEIFVSGAMIQEKARDIAANLGFTSFKCSNGWLDHFKTRFRISTRASRRADRPKEDDEVLVNQWLNKFLTVLKEYRAEDVFSLEVMDILCVPSQQNFENRCVNGGFETEKETLTFALCCNSNGSEKFSPWIVESPEKICCSKPADPKRLLDNQSCNIYEECIDLESGSLHTRLLEINSHMTAQNREILIILDNTALRGVKNLKFSNVKLYPFPRQDKFRLQPLHQGIISLLKSRFCDEFIQKMAETKEKNLQIMAQSVGERAMKSAWDSIPPDQIRSCFQNTWSDHDGLAHVETVLRESTHEDMRGLESVYSEDSNEQEKFLNTDDIGSRARTKPAVGTQGDYSGNNQNDWDGNSAVQVEAPSQEQIFNALDTLRTFAGTNNVTAEFLNCLDLITHECVDHHLRTKNKKDIS